jgi:hypothetical protein
MQSGYGAFGSHHRDRLGVLTIVVIDHFANWRGAGAVAIAFGAGEGKT